jgi:hypothetical protein
VQGCGDAGLSHQHPTRVLKHPSLPHTCRCFGSWLVSAPRGLPLFCSEERSVHQLEDISSNVRSLSGNVLLDYPHTTCMLGQPGEIAFWLLMARFLAGSFTQALVRAGYPYTIDAHRLHPVVWIAVSTLLRSHAQGPGRDCISRPPCVYLAMLNSAPTFGGFVGLLMCLVLVYFTSLMRTVSGFSFASG